MKISFTKVIILFLLSYLSISAQPYQNSVHHELSVFINPETHQISGLDEVTLPNLTSEYLFILDTAIAVSIENDPTAKLIKVNDSSDATTQIWKLLNTSKVIIKLVFSGNINHPVINEDTPGHIGSEGVSLFPSSGWYPYFFDHLEKFKLTVKMAQQWPAIAPGKIVFENTQNTIFEEQNPIEGIYLFSGPFYKTTKKSQDVDLNIYLKQAQPELANQLIESLIQSLEFYQKSIGQYPYTQFSVVENFWETGYGIPGITLLGPKVIQLPFLITSSLPHELLHNWWGNSVYVDTSYGNWSEGLTTYGADHWQQALKGTDSTYRRDTLIQYSNFVSSGKDFPLIQFKSRHDSSSQAIGYGKSMMFYHMLRNYLGPAQFQKSLSLFYQNFKFKQANWFDMKDSFTLSTNKNLDFFFNQWLTQTGAPLISIEKYSLKNNKLLLSLKQTNTQNIAYELLVPIKIIYKNSNEIRNISFNKLNQDFNFELNEDPVSIYIDSDFELFRQIYSEEVPVLFSAFFGEKNFNYMSLDSNSKNVPTVFAQKFNSVATEGFSIDSGSNNLIIGYNEEIKNLLNAALSDQGAYFSDSSVMIDGLSYDINDNTFGMSFRFKNKTYFWFKASHIEDPVRSAQRFTHYTNQSLVIFSKDKSPIKKTWTPRTSPLQIHF